MFVHRTPKWRGDCYNVCKICIPPQKRKISQAKTNINEIIKIRKLPFINSKIDLLPWFVEYVIGSWSIDKSKICGC